MNFPTVTSMHGRLCMTYSLSKVVHQCDLCVCWRD